MRNLILVIFTFITFPLLSSQMPELEDDIFITAQHDTTGGLSQDQAMENFLKSFLTQSAIANMKSFPSQSFEDLVSVLPESVHTVLKSALLSQESPLWEDLRGHITLEHTRSGQDVYMNLALIHIKEFLSSDPILQIHNEAQRFHEKKKPQMALKALLSVMHPPVRDFVGKVASIKPYEETDFDMHVAQLDGILTNHPMPYNELARVLIFQKIESKRHEQVYLQAANLVREGEHIEATWSFMKMLPPYIGGAMEGLLETRSANISSIQTLCENFYVIHKNDLTHIQDQALIKAVESAQKTLILFIDPYYHMDIGTL